jgi:hypothetical protein
VKKQFSLHDLFEVTNEAIYSPEELDLEVSIPTCSSQPLIQNGAEEKLVKLFSC